MTFKKNHKELRVIGDYVDFAHQNENTYLVYCESS